MSTYLGLDYGKSHVGVALSEHFLATPLATLSNSGFPGLIKALQVYVTMHHVDHLVCGLPEGELKPVIENFARLLEAELGLKVILWPETLSTQEAVAKLRAGGAKRSKLQNDHAYAACLILEDYLEGQSVVT